MQFGNPLKASRTMRSFTQTGSASQTRRRGGIALLLAVAGLAACVGGCDRGAEAKAAPPKPPIPVVVGKTQKRDVPIRVEAVGAAKALVNVMLKPQVSGVIVGKKFFVGPVEKGQVMYLIDARPFEAKLHEAEAKLGEDQAKLQQNEALAANARAEADRKKDLLKQGAANQFEYDRSETAAVALEAFARANRASIIADQAAIDDAKLDIEHCTIMSPIDGFTGPTLTDFGNVVKENETELIQLRQIVPSYIEVIVAQKYLDRVRAAMAKKDEENKGKADDEKCYVSMEITVPDSPDQKPIIADLRFVNSTVNEDTGTVTLRGIYKNEDKRLWPGQYLNIAIILGTRTGAVLVPTTALQTSQIGTYVYVVGADNKVAMRTVKAAEAVGDQTVIESGLEPDLTVVTEGQLRLTPGAVVEVRNGDAAPASPAPAAHVTPAAPVAKDSKP